MSRGYFLFIKTANLYEINSQLLSIQFSLL